jgi:hypothetical protein
MLRIVQGEEVLESLVPLEVVLGAGLQLRLRRRLLLGPCGWRRGRGCHEGWRPLADIHDLAKKLAKFPQGLRPTLSICEFLYMSQRPSEVNMGGMGYTAWAWAP